MRRASTPSVGNSRPRAYRPSPTTSGERLYESVARRLREEIANGVHPVGAQLPTEIALCRRFDVSRHTVRDALRLLREEGLVTSRQGSGTTVTPPPPSDSFHLEATSINDLVAYAAAMHTEIRATSIETIDAKLAARIGVPAGKEWLVVRGVARVRGKQTPVCWSDYYIHRDYAAVGRLLPRYTGPIFLLVEDFYAVTVVEIDQQISASVITPALATILKAKPGATAIEVRRTYRTADGSIVQVSVHTHPAQRFCHTMKMRRVKGS